MKVLFAVNNDNISDAIIKKYQKEYREVISYKNVYYFNAILKELQSDKSYDRVVISEDLEPFANNNFDTIDKFLFEKLDKISDEATKTNGDNMEIILVCSDRRSKSDDMLTKLFGIGIYNALIGDDRNIDNLCKLMYQPRNKKEAKIAYDITGKNVGYQVEDENNVSEAEVQNILAHYKRLGKNEDKYVESFNNIVSQYTDVQLKIIIRYLPLNVKSVLEEKSPKYQELTTFFAENGGSNSGKYMPRKIGNAKKQEEKIKVRMLKEEKGNITKPIVIPSSLNNKKTVKIEHKKPEISEEVIDNSLIKDADNEVKDIETKRRGRPRKNPISEVSEIEEDKPKRGRGRPKKNDLKEEDIDLFNITSDNIEENKEDIDLFNITSDEVEENKEDIDLFNMTSNAIEEDNGEVDLFNMDKTEEKNNNEDTPEIEIFDINEDKEPMQSNTMINLNIKPSEKLNTLLTREKKIVSFVGTTKNGTSFVVNNLALMLSSMNISTAILDTTQSKNAYYIFTKNEEQLRNIAENSIDDLEKGIAKGITVNKNLDVYTELPGNGQKHENIENILVTLMQNYDVVLIDADFNTNIEYFEKSQEIYLVQSMDILTIQPLTAFLRNLKSKNILKQEKLKIVINKWQKIASLPEKILIGGMTSYNDPGMAFMTELFDKNSVWHCKIPFEMQNYIKYLEALVNCEISLRGYTKQFIIALDELAGAVYPLLNQKKYTPIKGSKKNRMQFSDSTNNTLNKMKKNY